MTNTFNTKRIIRTAIIASLYAVLTIILSPISYGPIQVRISEALCILPLFFPESVIGVTVGCLIANIFGGNVFDMLFGTLATLLSATFSAFLLRKMKYGMRKLIHCVIFNVIFNALLVPLAFYLNGTSSAYLINACFIAVGELISVGVFGGGLYFAIPKLKTKILD